MIPNANASGNATTPTVNPATRSPRHDLGSPRSPSAEAAVAATTQSSLAGGRRAKVGQQLLRFSESELIKMRFATASNSASSGSRSA